MNYQNDKDNMSKCLRIFSYFANFFKDKRLESLGIASYLGGKIIFWSVPNIKEFFIAMIFVFVVRFYKKMAKFGYTEVLKEWWNNIDLAWKKFCERWIFPEFEPHDLIQWLTASKFDCNAACEEKIPFFNPDVKCRLKACRFTHKRKNMPRIMRRRWLSNLFVGNIFISEYLNTIKLGEIGSPGDFLAYDVFGIMFRVQDEYWSKISKEYSSQKKYRSRTVLELVVHISRFGGRIRLRIEAFKVGGKGGMAIIYGKYLNAFNPKRIEFHPKYISMPICDAWQHQLCPPSKWRRYTPINPIA